MSTRGTAVVMCNGILTVPGDAKDWNARGVTYINTHFIEYGITADLCQYFCGPIGRAFWQRGREKKLANLIKSYLTAGFEVVLVAHSNGCDVAIGALQRLGWPLIKALHLFSGATESDFRFNHLNWAVSLRKIGDVFVYVAGKDRWLRIARWPIGELLGYDGEFHWGNLFSFRGSLGLNGPVNVSADAQAHVHKIEEPSFDHSTWWAGGNFERSMERIVKPSA